VSDGFPARPDAEEATQRFKLEKENILASKKGT